MNDLEAAEYITRRDWNDLSPEERLLVGRLLQGEIYDQNELEVRNITRAECEEILDHIRPTGKTFQESKNLKEWILGE
jgi:hypothetical protein